jgi:uncharacterized protein (TIGR03437 family)
MRILVCCAFLAVAARAQTLSVVVTMPLGDDIPTGIIQGSNGNLYGLLSSNAIFETTLSGDLGFLYSPYGGGAALLVEASNGIIYGLSGNNSGQSIIFNLTSNSTLYTFPSDVYPNTLIEGKDGNLYGTTHFFTNQPPSGISETIFKLTLPGGVFTTLHNFTGADGLQPSALVEGSDGNIYGTTYYGGSGTCSLSRYGNGCGTVFKITSAGEFTSLFSFSPADGTVPNGVTEGQDGNFYGTAGNGGANSKGTAFKITPAGAYTLLYSFGATPSDAANPTYGLLAANDGNFYGVSYKGGGACTCGTIFKMTPLGAETVVDSFDSLSQPGGTGPQATSALLQASNGNLYGTFYELTSTTHGGVYTLPFPPEIPAIAPSAGVLNGASFQPGISPGSWITIVGNDLAPNMDTWNNAIVNGALPTSLDHVQVTIGGVPAYVEYISPGQINALAPDVAAGSQPVTVTTPIGASQSVNAQVDAVSPAFFQWGNYAVATHQDYSYAVKNGTFAGLTTVPAAPGDVIILWGTGFGATDPVAPAGMETPSNATYSTVSPVTVTIGSTSAQVYGTALAPGFAGLYQLAIQIPAGLANGDYPLVATIDNVAAPPVLISVQQ